MFLKLWNLINFILLNQRGEEEGLGDEGGGQGETPPEGQEEAPAGEGQESSGGQAETPPPAEETNWQEQFSGLQNEFESLKGKTTQTEKNLAATRKALESAGLKAVSDEYGQIHLMPVQKETSGKQRRFTDEHRTKFSQFFDKEEAGGEFLKLITDHIQDLFDDNISNYDRQTIQRNQWVKERDASNDRMIELYPSIDKSDKKTFNQAFFDKATQIWESKYQRFPNGELIAANEAAIEMNIAPSTLAQAQKAAYQKGKEHKEILGPVTGSQGKGQAGFKKLTFAEYSKLSSDEKAKYNEQEVSARKRGG